MWLTRCTCVRVRVRVRACACVRVCLQYTHVAIGPAAVAAPLLSQRLHGNGEVVSH